MHKPTHSIKPLYDVNITKEEIDEICRRHHILPQHRQCYWRMVARGEIFSNAFSRALVYQRNYECRRLIGACSPRCPTGLRNRGLIICLWRAGLRCSEALGLHAPRDLDNGVLRVRRGKGGKYRTVALDPEAWGVVLAWLECKRRLNIGGPVFSTLRGKPMQTSYIRSLFKRLGKRANIAKRCHPHGLRHSFAAGLADEKVDIRIIQRALGHSSLGTTARYVDHLNPTAVIDTLRSRTW